MNKSVITRKINIKFLVALIVLLIIAVGLYVWGNNNSIETTQRTKQLTIQQDEQSKFTESASESTQTASNFNLYFSIANSPAEKNIQRTYNDISNLNVSTLIENVAT